MLLILLSMPLCIFGAAQDEAELVRIVPPALSLQARCLDVVCRYEIEVPPDLHEFMKCIKYAMINQNLDIYIEHQVHRVIADFIQDSQNSADQGYDWSAACPVFVKFFRSGLVNDVCQFKSELKLVSPEILHYVCSASFSWRNGKSHQVRSGYALGLVYMPWSEPMRTCLFDTSLISQCDVSQIWANQYALSKKKKKKILSLLRRK